MVSGSLLYLFDHRFLFLGKLQDNTEHKHHAVQLIVGLDGPITLKFNNTVISCHCVLIASDTRHQINGSQTTQLHLLIDNESITAKKIGEKYFQEVNVNIFNESHARQLLKRADFFDGPAMTCSDAFFRVNELLGTLVDLQSDIKKSHDPRIQSALEKLQQSSLENITAADIAGQVCLSESRFIHLFSEEVGIPLRKYILWLRINRAIQDTMSGMSLTEAAYSAGFSDSAHLSRTFRNMFGLTLSEILKNSRFVQVFSCLSS